MASKNGSDNGGEVRRGRRPLMDIDGVAERLSVGVRHVRRLVAEERIPYVKWRHLLRFEPEEVEEWINDNRRPSRKLP